MTATAATLAPVTTHTLRNPAATRTGHVHYATYTPSADGTVVITLDDTVAVYARTVTIATARGDYRARLAGGWVKHELPAPAVKPANRLLWWARTQLRTSGPVLRAGDRPGESAARGLAAALGSHMSGWWSCRLPGGELAFTVRARGTHGSVDFLVDASGVRDVRKTTERTGLR